MPLLTYGTFAPVIALASGLATGLMSLVGIVAVFVTLNTQGAVNRAKDILWQIAELSWSESVDQARTLDRLRRLLGSYEIILREELGHPLVVSATIVAVACAMLAWGVAASLTATSVASTAMAMALVIGLAVVGEAVMVVFLIVLRALRDHRRAGNLRSVSELLDATSEGEVAAARLAGLLSLVAFVRNRTSGKYDVAFGVPIFVREFGVQNTARFSALHLDIYPDRPDGPSGKRLLKNDDIDFETPARFSRRGTYYAWWFVLEGLDEPDDVWAQVNEMFHVEYALKDAFVPDRSPYDAVAVESILPPTFAPVRWAPSWGDTDVAWRRSMLGEELRPETARAETPESDSAAQD